MGLLNLPSELLRAILVLLEPESFYVCLRTCKLFRQHALDSTTLLLRQLARIPGSNKFEVSAIGQRPSPELLLKEFEKRACLHLQDGSAWMADRHVWVAPRHSSRTKSFVTYWDPCWRPSCESSRLHANIANPAIGTERVSFIELRDDMSIHVYFLEPTFDDGCQPRLHHVISPQMLAEHCPGAREHGKNIPDEKIEVLKIVLQKPFQSPDLLLDSRVAVLYKVEALGKCGQDHRYLNIVYFRLDAELGPIVLKTISPGTPGTHGEVLTMTIDDYDVPFIVYGRYTSGRTAHKIAKYLLVCDDVDTLESTTTEEEFVELSDFLFEPEEKVADIIIERGRLQLYPSIIPMPQWTVSLDLTNLLFRRDTALLDISTTFYKPTFGKVLGHRHHHRHHNSPATEFDQIPSNCMNTALEFIISREEVDGFLCRTGAYLLTCIDNTGNCSPWDPHGISMNHGHVYVACLANFPDLDDLSTLGLKVAVSPRSHRIAIASWRTLRVWSLDPNAFLDPTYAESGGGPMHDYAFVRLGPWSYYASGEFDEDCILLQPIELPSAGVVYSLEFRGEDELWGWCEEGLVRWNIGNGCSGKRGVRVLE